MVKNTFEYFAVIVKLASVCRFKELKEKERKKKKKRENRSEWFVLP